MFFERINSNLSDSVVARGRVRRVRSLNRALIINVSADEIAVLGAILRRRGFATSATRFFDAGLRQLRLDSPDVIILDENAVYHLSGVAELATLAASIGCQLLVLGKLPVIKGRSKTWIEITTPYHYDTLVRKIGRKPRVRYAA